MSIVIFSVLMLMTISSFILPSDSAGKLTINGFSFMGSLLYLLYFGNTLPFHEVNVPVVGKYKMCERDYISIWFNNACFFLHKFKLTYFFQSYYMLITLRLRESQSFFTPFAYGWLQKINPNLLQGFLSTFSEEYF